MPALEVPLDALRVYRGASPCPPDIDAFWDAAVAEVYAMDDHFTMTPADFAISGVECFDCTFTGVGGARIYFKYLRPARKAKNRILLKFHGYSCNCGCWVDELPAVYAGFAVAMMDCRGQGGKSEDVGGAWNGAKNGQIVRGLESGDPKKLIYVATFKDCVQMGKIVAALPENDETDISTTGASQGGGLSLAAASLLPNVRRCVTHFPFLCDYRAAYRNLDGSVAFGEIKDYFFWHDPYHEHEDEIFSLLGYIDVQNLVHRITARVMMATGLQDVIVSPVTQFAAFNKIVSQKEHVLLPDYGHEFLNPFPDRAYRFLMD